MNLLPIGAVLGFIWTEYRAVLPGIRSNEETPSKFSLGYYLSNNWAKVLFNALGTGIAYLVAPVIGALLRYLMGRLIGDPEVVASISDMALQPLVGIVIGLFGARAVRSLFDRGNKKLDDGDLQ